MLGLIERNGKFRVVLGPDSTAEKLEVKATSDNPDKLAKKVLSEGAQLLLQQTNGANSRPDSSISTVTALGVQIRKEGKTIGVVTLQSRPWKNYDEEDLAVLQALADHGAGAMERIRAEEENQRLNRELRHHLEELQTLFAVAPVGIAVAENKECSIMMVNQACTSMLGLQSGRFEWRQADTNNLRMLRHGSELAHEDFPMQRAAREGAAVGGEELQIMTKTGSSVHCYAYASPLFTEDGHVRGSIGIFVDLTERKRVEEEVMRLNAELERRVHERTTQLEAINKELEAFSYSVSHDLRAPLRSIRGFSEVLLERYQTQLDARGQEFLKRVCDSCGQMDGLIEDLLKLSRVGRSEMQRRHVDLSQIAQSITSDLMKADPPRKVEVTIMPGLKAVGDEHLIRIAMENLLRNAWKFSKNNDRARIEFGAKPGPEAPFYIKDNGAGFDMAYSSKLFGVFQRLHTASEFPGTGVGLATVQRIINRHGGKVWATGEVDRGACFFFTLPDNDVETRTPS